MLYKQIKVFQNKFLFLKMTYADLFKNSSITNKDIKIISKLGKGTYGDVYRLKMENGEGALKVLRIDNGFPNPIELHVMSSYRHPNLMTLDKTILRSRKKIGLLMPLAEYNLTSVLDRLSIKAKQKIILDVTNGLNFLHEHRILHLDIKDDNILILGDLENPVGQLHDFGLSMMIPTDEPMESNTLKITYLFRPPEIEDKFPIYCQKGNDIWSLGLLFMTILNGGFPFKYEVSIRKGRDTLVIPEDEFLRVLYERLESGNRMSIIRKYSNSFYAPIIDKMLKKDVKERVNTQEILQYLCNENIPSFYANGSIVQIKDATIQCKPFHQTHISAILNKLVTKYNPDIFVVFLYYDLCYRSLSCVKLKTVPKGPNKILMAFFTACVWISLKFFTNDVYEVKNFASVFEVPVTKLLEMEIRILQYIKGIIYRPFLYELCTCLDDLAYCYKLCIEGTKYSQLNLEKIKEKLKNTKDSTRTRIESKKFISEYTK